MDATMIRRVVPWLALCAAAPAAARCLDKGHALHWPRGRPSFPELYATHTETPAQTLTGAVIDGTLGQVERVGLVRVRLADGAVQQVFCQSDDFDRRNGRRRRGS